MEARIEYEDDAHVLRVVSFFACEGRFIKASLTALARFEKALKAVASPRRLLCLHKT